MVCIFIITSLEKFFYSPSKSTLVIPEKLWIKDIQEYYKKTELRFVLRVVNWTISVLSTEQRRQLAKSRIKTA